MNFEIIGEIKKIRLIADKKRIRILQYLIESYGKGNWKKLSGEAAVEDENGERFIAEVHYYEAPGIGRVDFKIIDKLRDIDKEDI
ncbi:MAG TPA: hypothetical protein PLX69_12435 [Leptospiraceae bacterium]|nr:hypothetical protein [Leptospiraceae bacterium]